MPTSRTDVAGSLVRIAERLIVAGWESGTKREFKFDPNSTENEGRWRLYDPSKIDKKSYFRRKSSTSGVSYVMGKANGGPADGKTVIQAVRFDKEKFTEADAAKWWEKNHGRDNLVFSDEDRSKKAMNKEMDFPRNISRAKVMKYRSMDDFVATETIRRYLEDNGVRVNNDDTVTLYHATSGDRAAKIEDEGEFHGGSTATGGMTGLMLEPSAFFGVDREWVENTWKGGESWKVIEVRVPVKYIRHPAQNFKEVYFEGGLKKMGSVWVPKQPVRSTFVDRLAFLDYGGEELEQLYRKVHSREAGNMTTKAYVAKRLVRIARMLAEKQASRPRSAKSYTGWYKTSGGVVAWCAAGGNDDIEAMSDLHNLYFPGAKDKLTGMLKAAGIPYHGHLDVQKVACYSNRIYGLVLLPLDSSVTEEQIVQAGFPQGKP